MKLEYSQKNRGDLRSSIIERGIHPLSSTYLFPRRVLTDIGGFDESLKSCIDADLWVNLASHDYHAECIPKALVVNRQFNFVNQMTNKAESRIEGTNHFSNKWEDQFCTWLEKKTERGI